MKHFFPVAGFLVLLAGCATAGPARVEPKPALLDLHAIQHDLGMALPEGQVGYLEKRFDACRYESDLPEIKDCSKAFFVLIGFQLACRPTQEASSEPVLDEDLEPVRLRALKWQLGSLSGELRSDAEGFGLIRAISQQSARKKPLRISTGVDFLIVSAGSASNLVTPISWCTGR